jgi:phospholipid-binding lipoprotein MlaA
MQLAHFKPLASLLLGGAFLGLSTVALADDDIWDPLEPVNRGIYWFNKKFDRYLAKPVAKAYRWTLPQLVRTGVGNFFENLAYPATIASDLAQLKMGDVFLDVGRMITNSSVGLGGFLDVATPLGLAERDEDVGQVMGYWGLGHGMYLMLPFLGPSSLRDATGMAMQTAVVKMDIKLRPSDIQGYNDKMMYGLIGLDAIDKRAQLLGAEDVVEEGAVDEYRQVRNAYLQRRRNQVYDGKPPMAYDSAFDEKVE